MQVHICLLRALAWHDSKLQRQARKLDLAKLDETTWKDYLWEFLRYLHCFDWWRQHVIARPPEQPAVDLATGEPCAAVPTDVQKPAAGAMPPKGDDAASAAAWSSFVRRLNTMDGTPDELMMRAYADLSVSDRFALLTLLTDVLLLSLIHI